MELDLALTTWEKPFLTPTLPLQRVLQSLDFPLMKHLPSQCRALCPQICQLRGEKAIPEVASGLCRPEMAV